MNTGSSGTASAEFAATVLRASADTVSVFSPAGRILFVSTTKQNLAGRPAREWEGRDVRDLIHPDDVAAFIAMLEIAPESIDGPRRDVIRIRVLSARDEWVVVEARGFTRIDCESVVGSVVSMRDAAGLLGLSESQSLAETTLLRDVADGATIDNRDITATEILPSVLRSCSGARHLCVVSLRMTNFDDVSTMLGRGAADDAIVQTARAILPTLRQSDLVVRVLDRRLIVVCPGLGASVVAEFANRLRRVCENLDLSSGATVEPSIGFALSSHGDDLREVLDYAIDANQLDAPHCQNC